MPHCIEENSRCLGAVMLHVLTECKLTANQQSTDVLSISVCDRMCKLKTVRESSCTPEVRCSPKGHSFLLD